MVMSELPRPTLRRRSRGRCLSAWVAKNSVSSLRPPDWQAGASRDWYDSINNANHSYYGDGRCQPHFVHDARVHACARAAAGFDPARQRCPRPSRLGVPRTPRSVLAGRSGVTSALTANSGTRQVRPAPVPTSPGTRPSRRAPRRRARGWPPRGCGHARRAGTEYAR